MKKQILSLALVLSALSLTFANNTPSTSTLMLSVSETSFIIDFTAFDGDANSVSIVDEDGNSIFMDKIKSNNQRIKYILNKLQTGTYTVKIKGEKTVEYYTINLDRNAVSIVEKETYSSPTVIKKENKIIVQSGSLSPQTMNFSIFNSDGEKIYRNAGFSQKVFNLKELNKGKYRVLVTNEEFSKELFVSL